MNNFRPSKLPNSLCYTKMPFKGKPVFQQIILSSYSVQFLQRQDRLVAGEYR